MTDRKTTQKSATPTQDSATLARQQLLERQRFLATRKLLKRRRRKSHQ